MEKQNASTIFTDDIPEVNQLWPTIAKVVVVSHTAAEYDQLVSLLDPLIDTVGEDETRPLASLMEIVGVLIEQYEDAHISEITDY